MATIKKRIHGSDKVISNWRSRCILILMTAMVVLYVSGLYYKCGTISQTHDEKTDLSISHCYAERAWIRGCTASLNQTRFPHYIHAALIALDSMGQDTFKHYALSGVFATLNLILIFWFVRRERDGATALVAVALCATLPPLLALARMILTHSNVIFCSITLASVFSLYEFRRTTRQKWQWLACALYGLSVATTMIGVVTAAFVVVFLQLTRQPQEKLWTRTLPLFGLLSFIAFLIGTPEHLNMAKFEGLISQSRVPDSCNRIGTILVLVCIRRRSGFPRCSLS